LRASLAVPAGGPLFEGHFPGRPILPGVALLDLALRALDPLGSPEGLATLDFLRLRRVVLPGEHLEIEVEPAETLRLTVRRGEELVAQAGLTLGDAAPVAAEAARRLPATPRGHVGMPELSEADVPDLDRLLPHRPPMRFITGIEAKGDDGIVCSVRLAERGPFTAEGTAPALVAIEMAAQAAAAFAGLRASGAPRPGYLVGARDVRFHRRRIPAGAPCSAAVRMAGGAGDLSTFDFEVLCGGEKVASGTLSTWLTSTAA
jgi:predicted hotdog family 3-hydroxylacyl-ACP dehydratase